MSKKTLALAALSLLLVAACTKQEEQQAADALLGDDAAIASARATASAMVMADGGGDEEQSASSINPEDRIMADGVEDGDEGPWTARYVPYEEGVIGNGWQAMLFFHAPWCPECKEADEQLKGIYMAGLASIPTYVVDYDSSASLRARYGVTYQHTFVKIDGQGNAVTVQQGATEAQLREMVR